MPSPFPGMDPYLEGEMWQEFHETMANAIRAQLMSALTPRYVALLAKRYVLDRPIMGIFGLPEEMVFYPDVHVVAPSGMRPGPVLSAYGASPTDAGVAVAEPTVNLISPIPTKVPVLSVEIRDVAERRLVTVIEILSPVNKRGEGASKYAERRLELIQTPTHLLEIDLLRRGRRILLVGQLPPAFYYIYLSRVQHRPFTQVWPITLPELLPAVPVPLLPPDPDVALDLQAALNACFDLVGYERLLNYSVPLPPPELDEETAAWITETLHAAGLADTPVL